MVEQTLKKNSNIVLMALMQKPLTMLRHACRERMTTLMFEDFNVPAMYVAIQVSSSSLVARLPVAACPCLR